MLVVISVLASGCAGRFFKKGNKAYNALQYDKANYYFKRYLDKKPTNLDARQKLADGYRLTHQPKKAETNYAKLVKSKKGKVDPQNIFYYAKMLQMNGKYDEAAEWFRTYDSLNSGNPLAPMLAKSCDSIASFRRDTNGYTINEIPFRKVGDRFCAVPFDNGIAFAGEPIDKNAKKYKWPTHAFVDMFSSTFDTTDQSWGAPVAFKGPVSGAYNDGPACFTADGQTMYFTRNNYVKGTDKLKKTSTLVNNLKIYRAEYGNKESFEKIKELSFNSDDYSCMHPSITRDGLTMYFASDMPDGQGGLDLYMSTLDTLNNEWSKPVNLGPTINTTGNEAFPNVDADGTLTFSSDGHPNMGGLDIFRTSKVNGTWSQPENVGDPINSSMDDYGYYLKNDGVTGYVSSNRSNGHERIYSFTKNEPILAVEGYVMDKATEKALVGASVEIINQRNGLVNTVVTNNDGHFQFDSVRVKTNYTLKASMPGYFAQSTNMVTGYEEKTKTLSEDFALTKLVIEQPFVLRNIYYDFNKASLRKTSYRTLDSLVHMMKDNPTFSIEISSHTDCRGKAWYNLKLSQRRAKSAATYLVKKGVPVKRLTWKGYGEKNIINECKDGHHCTEAGHQANRRTEFKVIKVAKK